VHAGIGECDADGFERVAMRAQLQDLGRIVPRLAASSTWGMGRQQSHFFRLFRGALTDPVRSRAVCLGACSHLPVLCAGFSLALRSLFTGFRELFGPVPHEPILVSDRPCPRAEIWQNSARRGVDLSTKMNSR
jgi:hypothetical protein